MTEDVRQKYFPLKITYSDYVHQGNSLRDMRSRIIIVRIKVSSLNLDEHALDKLARLAGSRYNRETDILTIVTDRFVSSVLLFSPFFTWKNAAILKLPGRSYSVI